MAGLGLGVEGAARGRGKLAGVRRILLVKLDGIGDFVLLTPFLRELRAAAPGAEIDLVVAPWTLELAEGCPLVDRVVGMWAKRSADGRVEAQTCGREESRRRFLENYAGGRYELAVVPRWDRDEGMGSYVARGSGAGRRVGFTRPAMAAGEMEDYARLNFTEVVERGWAAHEVEHSMALLGVLTGEGEAERGAGPVELWVEAGEMAAGERMLREVGMAGDGGPVVAVCPGASGRNREMPAPKLRAMLQRVEGLVPGVRFVFLGRPGDREVARTMVGGLRSAAELCGRTTLREMVAVLSRMTAAVVMDSGPAHLAAAAEVPTVVLSPHPVGGDPIDNHSPVRFRPWGAAESVVVQPAMAVWPCRERCRGEGPNCIVAVDDETVAQTVRRLVEERMAGGRERISA